MNYLIGPYSRDYGYDDDYEGYSPPLKLWELILGIPGVFLFSILMVAIPWLYGGWYLLKAEFSTLRNIVANGKMPLASVRVGIFAVFLAYLLTLCLFPHARIYFSLYLIFAVVFALFFSVFPVFAFFMHWVRRIHVLISQRNRHH